ncbi:MAG: WbqC family protein [Candidatus Sulfotelmatobacter sp.]
MKIAISQPGYLPWAGFFDLIDQVDQFVLLDDAQFVKQSWHQRNRIKSSAGLQWLTVPVVFRGRLGQPLSEVEIREPEFWQKHLRSFEVNYGRARYFGDYFPRLKEVLEMHGPGKKLIDLNLALIQWLAAELSVKTPMMRSSSLGLEGKRSGHLVAICERLGAADYLSPRSATYLLDDLAMFAEDGIAVSFQNYNCLEYQQRFPPFLPYASVVDLLFNEGPESGGIMRGGRGVPFTPDQIREVSENMELKPEVGRI